METLDVNSTKNLLEITGGNFRRSGKYHIGACPFCGGRDRFTIKHTRRGDRWHCRQCGDGKYHTVIDFIMRRDNVDFKTAYQTLAGAEYKAGHVHSQREVKKEGRPINLPPREWQAEAFRVMDEGSDRLLDIEEGLTGREYLEQRGLSRAVWLAWQLGFSQVWDPKAGQKRPAILVPWLDMNAQSEVISSIKYRFIGQHAEGLRYISKGGSIPLLFGLWDVIEADTTLLLAEGEFNALSIWQCRPRGVSVLSFGSQSGGRMDVLRTLSRRYARIHIWCDDPHRTKEIQAMLGRTCSTLQSPVLNGVKMDANGLLQAGVLARVLTKLLGVECLGLIDGPLEQDTQIYQPEMCR